MVAARLADEPLLEVLLANGASLVYAIDVGRGQLHPSLHGNPKIVSMEETDIRSLAGKRLEIRPDVVVIDVSFDAAAIFALLLARRSCNVFASFVLSEMVRSGGGRPSLRLPGPRAEARDDRILHFMMMRPRSVFC